VLFDKVSLVRLDIFRIRLFHFSIRVGTDEEEEEVIGGGELLSVIGVIVGDNAKSVA